MRTIAEFMTDRRKACDELFAQAEDAAGDWTHAADALAAFRRALEQQLAMEENVLFTAFEQQTGMTGSGPTERLRDEHAHMRALADALADAVANRDQRDYFGFAETLLNVMQQHSAKENSMMYPMLDSVFAGRVDELIASTDAIGSGGACSLHRRTRA